MKKAKNLIKSGIISTLAYLLISTSLMAQAPQKMSYQAVIRGNNSKLISNQKVGMQISIIQSSTNGSKVYVETQTANTNANGLVSIEIGSGTVVSGDFSAIDWTNGPFYIKTETDPSGGANYSISGTSQLLSVPYALHSNKSQHSETADSALHANTADSIVGGVAETDPVYTNSQAANITGTDITNLSNLSGVNTGDQNLSSLATKTALGDSTAQVRSEIPDVPSSTQKGEMQYWNGSKWVTVPIGYDNAILTLVKNVPTWVGGNIPTPNVTSSTGRIWMDRNLGASQVATSSTDAAAYGDLYQWGRGTDGHEKRTNISTTTTLSTKDSPGHGDFIETSTAPNDWRSPQNDNLWQGVAGINNPCPTGYRIPTEAELDAEYQSWGSQDAAGAYKSSLKLTMGGIRFNGTLYIVGTGGYYWSSTISTTPVTTGARYLLFDSNSAGINWDERARAYSVRCIKD